jgi:CBS-domain-containing membrane protein
LLQDPIYRVSIRARTVVRVIVMSRNMFSEISGAMGPSRGVLAEIVARRSQALWLYLPALKDALSKQPLSSFIEPSPAHTLNPDSTLQQALVTLTESELGFLLVLDDEKCLVGVLKTADVANALLLIVSTPEESRRDATQVRVRELLAEDPLTISSDDSSLLAGSTMREHGLSWIPVIVSQSDRRLKGLVRAERITYWMLEELGKQTLLRVQTATLGEEEKKRTVA